MSTGNDHLAEVSSNHRVTYTAQFPVTGIGRSLRHRLDALGLREITPSNGMGPDLWYINQDTATVEDENHVAGVVSIELSDYTYLTVEEHLVKIFDATRAALGRAVKHEIDYSILDEIASLSDSASAFVFSMITDALREADGDLAKLMDRSKTAPSPEQQLQILHRMRGKFATLGAAKFCQTVAACEAQIDAKGTCEQRLWRELVVARWAYSAEAMLWHKYGLRTPEHARQAGAMDYFSH